MPSISSKTDERMFIDVEKLRELSNIPEPTESELNEILNKSLKYKGLNITEAAKLLAVTNYEHLTKMLQTAHYVKEKIYGKRLVMFAPLYVGNECSNECLYCGFRKGNKTLHRARLTMEQVEQEVKSILKTGHKRILMLSGESEETPFEYFLDALDTAYKTRYGNDYIRRINVEIAPLEVEQFAELKKSGIGTYACFQETYDPELYSKYHRSGPKADYLNRLTVMHRAMDGGLDDVGIGVLYGLGEYKFETLAMFEHSRILDKEKGCAPHTISIPRIEPADDAPYSKHVPYPVTDEQFKKVVAVIRLSMPWTGLILTTREKEDLRTELFNYGVSQISAGSKTNPGAYADTEENTNHTGQQFSLGDHRSLEEVVSDLIDQEYIPSMCTACYRMGRVGADFMDLAKPGLIKEFCDPNGIITFMEYLYDYATPLTKDKGFKLAEKLINEVESEKVKARMMKNLERVKNGERDLYF